MNESSSTPGTTGEPFPPPSAEFMKAWGTPPTPGPAPEITEWKSNRESWNLSPPPKRKIDNHVWLIPCGPGHDPAATLGSIPGEKVVLVDDGAGLDRGNYDPDLIRVVKTGGSGTGCAHALNCGLFSGCEGDWDRKWIYRMDADDQAYPGHDRDAKAEWYHEGEVVVGGCMVRTDGKRMNLIAKDWNDMTSILALRRNPLFHPATIIRHDALVEVGGWPENYGRAEDYALWIKLRHVGKLQPVESCWTIYSHFAGLNPIMEEDRAHDLARAAEEAGL